MTQICDFLSETVDLESIVRASDALKYPFTKNQQSWDRFHIDYLNIVGPVVGIKRDTPNQNKLSKTERTVFAQIFEAYNDKAFPKDLKNIFNSYEGFFYSFFIRPYGFSYKKGEYIDLLPQLYDKYKTEKEKEEKNQKEIDMLREQIKAINFARNIDLAKLFVKSLESTKKKIKVSANEIDISYKTDSGETINTRLTPEASSSFWESIFSSGEDCIFINKKHKEDKIVFEKYWFASLLHSYHPKIFYLNFRTQNSKTPQPMYRIKFMESVDEHNRKYLIVGGILGENFRRIKTIRGTCIEEQINKVIQEFFRRNYSKNDFLLYNFNHIANEDKPYNQFIDYIKRRYSIDEEKLKKIGEVNNKSCTHRLKVRYDYVPEKELQILAAISTFDDEGNPKYNGEQYSETFEVNRDKNTTGAFVSLDGLIRGYEMKYNKTRRENTLKCLTTVSNGILGLFMIFLAARITSIIDNYKIDNDEYYISQKYYISHKLAQFRFRLDTSNLKSEQPTTENTPYKGKLIDIISEQAKYHNHEEIVKKVKHLLEELCEIDSSSLDKCKALTCLSINSNGICENVDSRELDLTIERNIERERTILVAEKGYKINKEITDISGYIINGKPTILIESYEGEIVSRIKLIKWIILNYGIRHLAPDADYLIFDNIDSLIEFSFRPETAFTIRHFFPLIPELLNEEIQQYIVSVSNDNLSRKQESFISEPYPYQTSENQFKISITTKSGKTIIIPLNEENSHFMKLFHETIQKDSIYFREIGKLLKWEKSKKTYLLQGRRQIYNKDNSKAIIIETLDLLRTLLVHRDEMFLQSKEARNNFAERVKQYAKQHQEIESRDLLRHTQSIVEDIFDIPFLDKLSLLVDKYSSTNYIPNLVEIVRRGRFISHDSVEAERFFSLFLYNEEIVSKIQKIPYIEGLVGALDNYSTISNQYHMNFYKQDIVFILNLLERYYKRIQIPESNKQSALNNFFRCLDIFYNKCPAMLKEYSDLVEYALDKGEYGCTQDKEVKGSVLLESIDTVIRHYTIGDISLNPALITNIFPRISHQLDAIAKCFPERD
ncbi:hypothetical protein J4232_00790 [Candidatus Woesearchaeota archaeon]|nr:hypothetical protein [Candidatus Woesearchaeota archaeon]